MKKKRQNALKYFFSFKWLLVLPVLFYKKCLSPLMPNVCIYYPSCSTYMLECIKEFGLKGVFYGLKRLIRCTPNRDGGYDPPPINRKGEIKWLF